MVEVQMEERATKNELYDYFVAGRWRNRDAVREVAQSLRAAGHSVYCFIDNPYEGDGILFETHDQADPEAMMASLESIENWQTNATLHEIYTKDMQALEEAKL